MGYLPIILALLGFIFLWGIVNYYSIKTRHQEIDSASELAFRYASLRQNILLQLTNIPSEDSSLHHLLQRVRKSIRPYDKDSTSPFVLLASEKNTSRQIDVLSDQLGSQKIYRTSIQQLQKADMAYRVASNRFSIKVKQYNELVTRPPSNLVAFLTGFKKVKEVESSES